MSSVGRIFLLLLLVGVHASSNDKCLPFDFMDFTAPEINVDAQELLVAVNLTGDNIPFKLHLESDKEPMYLNLDLHADDMPMILHFNEFSTLNQLLAVTCLVGVVAAALTICICMAVTTWQFIRIRKLEAELHRLRQEMVVQTGREGVSVYGTLQS
jgi:hypothetical protein